MGRFTVTARVLWGLAALITAAVWIAGCGGGGGSVSPFTANEQLFVPNYIPALNALYTWGRLPVRVTFILPDNWQQLFSSNPDFYIDAANEWNRPNRQAMISVVAAGQPADVSVSFVYQSELGGNTYGQTSYTVDSAGYMRSASIKVALYNSRDRLINAIDVGAVIAHEIGHALGINGHSPNATDLMYATHTFGTSENASVLDLNTAMTAYPGYFSPEISVYGRPTRSDAREVFHGVIECECLRLGSQSAGTVTGF